MRARLARSTFAERDLASAQLVFLLEQSSCWRDSKVIAVYSPLPGEPDLGSLIIPEKQTGKSLLFPRCLPETQALELRHVAHTGALHPGPFSLAEPDPQQCPLLASHAVPDLILVPGQAFDRQGGRLGRGLGYYDRLLSSLPVTVCRLGVFFSWQEVVRVPREAHDQLLQGIITEKELFLL
jgi:5-formyltetrahydrofolate cyclo-ligase